jgi:hypothetical protein
MRTSIGHGTRGAEALDLVRDEHAQELRLEAEVGLADLVEESVPPFASSILPSVRVSTPANAPGSHPKSSRSSRSRGNGRALDP